VPSTALKLIAAPMLRHGGLVSVMMMVLLMMMRRRRRRRRRSMEVVRPRHGRQ